MIHINAIIITLTIAFTAAWVHCSGDGDSIAEAVDKLWPSSDVGKFIFEFYFMF
jgi:hypothetical protein